jgi:hypothetical protein
LGARSAPNPTFFYLKMLRWSAYLKMENDKTLTWQCRRCSFLTKNASTHNR